MWGPFSSSMLSLARSSMARAAPWALATTRRRHQVFRWNDVSEEVDEFAWNLKEIVAAHKQSPLVHIEYNGVDHYAALVCRSGAKVACSAEASRVLTASPKVQRSRGVTPLVALQSLGWKALPPNRLRADVSEVKSRGHASAVSKAMFAEARREGYNAILCLEDESSNSARYEIRFLKFDFFLTDKNCYDVVDKEVQMYVDELQAKFSPVPKHDNFFSCICQKYSFKSKKDEVYVECVSCLRGMHPRCAFPMLKRKYTRQDLDALAKEYVCSECASTAAMKD